jgi:hypothetical protein
MYENLEIFFLLLHNNNPQVTDTFSYPVPPYSIYGVDAFVLVDGNKNALYIEPPAGQPDLSNFANPLLPTASPYKRGTQVPLIFRAYLVPSNRTSLYSDFVRLHLSGTEVSRERLAELAVAWQASY